MDEEHRKTESCLHDILRPLRVILLEQVFPGISILLERDTHKHDVFVVLVMLV